MDQLTFVFSLKVRKSGLNFIFLRKKDLSVGNQCCSFKSIRQWLHNQSDILNNLELATQGFFSSKIFQFVKDDVTPSERRL